MTTKLDKLKEVFEVYVPALQILFTFWLFASACLLSITNNTNDNQSELKLTYLEDSITIGDILATILILPGLIMFNLANFCFDVMGSVWEIIVLIFEGILGIEVIGD